MNKRGLSDVVTTVLIILLVLAAVAIIWAFIRPAITRSVSQVTGDCITLNLKPISCINSGTGVQVHRDNGKANLKELVLIYKLPSGDEQRIVVNNTNDNGVGLPQELETKTYDVDTAALIDTPVSMKIAGKIGVEGNPELKTCDSSGEEVECTQ